MADWDKLNEELDSALDSMSKEDWINWKNTITICTGIGANMFFPEYVTIEIPKSNYKLWEETGLLDNINSKSSKINIAELMESKASKLI